MKLLCLALLVLGLVVPPASAFQNSPVQGYHQDVLSRMEVEEPLLLPSVQVLWRATLMRNPTLQLALQKIGEKSGQIPLKDKSQWTQRLLQGMLQMGGMGGSFLLGNPAPMIGSTVLGRVTAPDTAPRKLTEVTSADLVLLTQEIELAQSQLIQDYLEYRQARTMRAEAQRRQAAFQETIKTLPQEDAVWTESVRTMLLDHGMACRQAEETVQARRNLLVLAAGEAALEEADQLFEHPTPTADKATRKNSPEKPPSVSEKPH